MTLLPKSGVTTSAVHFSAIRKSFGHVEALRGIDLTIHEGEFFALLGPNGAGKTTLISILGGLTRANHGTVSVLGSDIHTDYRAARRKIGIVPQELTFDPFFTVRETLQFQSGYFGLRRNDSWIDALLHHLGLTDKANSNMRALSGGMKRRVMIAQALVHKPPVIVLDEPTAGVDVALRQSLWQFIQQLNRDGHTIILTTHYLEEAEALCSRIAMLKQGQLVALDDKTTLLAAHKTATVKLLLSSANLPSTLQSLLIAMKNHETENWFQFALADCAALEGILASLRSAQIEVLDMEIQKPDLESIFLAVTQQKSL